MNKSTTRLLFLLMTVCFLHKVKGQCSTTGTNGIAACQCNFMEACDAQGNPNPNLAKYLPTGVDQLGLAEKGQRDLAYLCEGGDAVGILYDCHNRIPLYATTVIYGAQLLGVNRGLKRRPRFSKSRQIKRFQQRDKDYKDASKRELCYSSLLGGKNYVVEEEWTNAIGNSFFNAQPCPRGLSVETSISRGHLIASQYGRNNQTKKEATFIYTNVVPQFATFNSGSWQEYETKLITWGTQNCAEVKGATNVRLFIVVGAIPSTVRGPSKQRYFGKEGFSDYKKPILYPVNVPSHMWTAACCTYSDKGTLRYRSTAFWRENNPGNAPCNRANVGFLTRWLSGWIASGTVSFDLFPQTSQCNNINYHIPLP